MNFFAELKRRSVYKVGAAYVVVAWLLDPGRDPDVSVFRDSKLDR